MMINGVWKPDVVPTVEEQEAEGALAEAMVDQGYLNFREDHRGQNRRYASKLIWGSRQKTENKAR
jgi:hypothetical protein